MVPPREPGRGNSVPPSILARETDLRPTTGTCQIPLQIATVGGGMKRDPMTRQNDALPMPNPIAGRSANAERSGAGAIPVISRHRRVDASFIILFLNIL
jgi:hypothetical protein